jgi:hypothetical protein
MESEFNVPPRHIEEFLPSVTISFPFRAVLTCPASIAPDFTAVVGSSRFPCHSLILATIFPPLLPALVGCPDLTEFCVDIDPDSPSIPSLLNGTTTSPPFEKLSLPSFLRTLSSVPPSFPLRTKTETHYCHKFLYSLFCTTPATSFSDADVSLSDISNYLSGESIIVTSSNIAILQSGADLLGLTPILRLLPPLWSKFRLLGRSLALSSLQQWLLAISPHSYDRVLSIVTGSTFFNDSQISIVELVLSCACVRPLARGLYLDLLRYFLGFPAFVPVIRWECVHRLRTPAAPHWLFRQLFKLGAFSIEDVIREFCHKPFGFPGTSHIDSECRWYIREIRDRCPPVFERWLTGQKKAGEDSDPDADLAAADTGLHPDAMIGALRRDDIDAMEDILAAEPDFDFQQLIPGFFFDPIGRPSPDSLRGENMPISAVPLYYGSVRCFKALLLKNVNFKSVFTFAMFSGNSEIIRLCEQKGAVFDQWDAWVAVQHQRNDIYRWLMENNPDIPVFVEYNPYEYHYARVNGAAPAAISKCNLEIMLWLSQIGLHERKIDYKSMLQMAIDAQWVEIVRIILAVDDTDVNGVNSQDETKPLIHAIASGNLEIVRLLLEWPGIDVKAALRRPLRPIQVALHGHPIGMAELLIEKMGLTQQQIDDCKARAPPDECALFSTP